MINFKVWLTVLCVTSGVWLAFENGAKAQNAGTITIRADGIVIENGNLTTDSTTNPIIRTNDSNTSVNSGSYGGNIIVTTGPLIISKGTSIPEPSFVVGILAVAGAAVVSRLKHKRK